MTSALEAGRPVFPNHHTHTTHSIDNTQTVMADTNTAELHAMKVFHEDLAAIIKQHRDQVIAASDEATTTTVVHWPKVTYKVGAKRTNYAVRVDCKRCSFNVTAGDPSLVKLHAFQLYAWVFPEGPIAPREECRIPFAGYAASYAIWREQQSDLSDLSISKNGPTLQLSSRPPQKDSAKVKELKRKNRELRRKVGRLEANLETAVVDGEQKLLRIDELEAKVCTLKAKLKKTSKRQQAVHCQGPNFASEMRRVRNFHIRLYQATMQHERSCKYDGALKPTTYSWEKVVYHTKRSEKPGPLVTVSCKSCGKTTEVGSQSLLDLTAFRIYREIYPVVESFAPSSHAVTKACALYYDLHIKEQTLALRQRIHGDIDD